MTPELMTAPQNSLDALNPVTRLGMALIVSIPILITLDVVSATTMLICVAIGLLASRFPLKIMALRMLPIVVMAPIGALSMALYGKTGGAIYWQWGIITVSERSVELAIAVLLRIIVLGLVATVLVGSADPTRMADGLAQLVKLPERFVLGTLAGIRMLGLFVADWKSMRLARRARGLGDTGRIRRFFTMAFALLVFAIRRGSKLATAMEARGFGMDRKRTWARPSVLRRRDYVALALAVAAGVISLGVAIYTGLFWLVFQD